MDWDEDGLAPAAHALGTYLARLDHDALTGTPILDRALQIVPQTDPVTAAADPALMTRLSGQPIARAALIRHRPGRRALFRYDDRLIGKMRVKGPDRRRPALHDRLRAARLNGTGNTGVPAQRGRVDALNLWRHAASVTADRDWSMADEIAVMDRALNTPDTRALADHLSRAALTLPPGPGCGIHRDFYPDQVLIDDASVWLLDLDLYTDGDPAIDLGNMLGHLDEYALRRGWDCAALDPQAAAFLTGYATLRLLPAHVALMRAVSLARHVAIARRFDDRRHGPPLILRQLARMGMAPT